MPQSSSTSRPTHDALDTDRASLYPGEELSLEYARAIHVVTEFPYSWRHYISRSRLIVVAKWLRCCITDHECSFFVTHGRMPQDREWPPGVLVSVSDYRMIKSLVRETSAVQIQSLVRGHLLRVRLREICRQWPPSFEDIRQFRFMESEIEEERQQRALARRRVAKKQSPEDGLKVDALGLASRRLQLAREAAGRPFYVDCEDALQLTAEKNSIKNELRTYIDYRAQELGRQPTVHELESFKPLFLLYHAIRMKLTGERIDRDIVSKTLPVVPNAEVLNMIQQRSTDDDNSDTHEENYQPPHQQHGVKRPERSMLAHPTPTGVTPGDDDVSPSSTSPRQRKMKNKSDATRIDLVSKLQAEEVLAARETEGKFDFPDSSSRPLNSPRGDVADDGVAVDENLSLQERYFQLKTEARILKKALFDYEEAFFAKHGRKMKRRADIQPVEQSYRRFKIVKQMLAEIEAQMV